MSSYFYEARNSSNFKFNSCLTENTLILCYKYDAVMLREIRALKNYKLNMYSVWHNNTFILLLLFYYWLQVSASKGHHKANIYKKNLKCWCIRYKNLNVIRSHLQLLPAFGCVICCKLWWDFILSVLSMYFPNFPWLTTLTLRRQMSYIYGAPILDVSRSHTTTQHSR